MAFPVVNGTEVLLPAPEGWVVNFTHPYRDETTKTNVFLAFGIEFPITTLFLAQRVYTSLFVKRKFLIDDYLIAFLVVTQAMVLHLWSLGLVGLHAWEQSLDKTIYMSGIIHAMTLTAILGTVLAKLVLCLFYYRLSPAPWYRYGILLTAFLCVACSGSAWLAVMFACRPVAAAWDLRLLHTGAGGGGSCIPRPPWYLLQAIAGGVTDLLLILQPIPTVMGLHMSAGRKAALLVWFGLGTVTLAASVMRLHILLSTIADPDMPWAMADAMLWLVVESNLIVLCGCLPTFQDFVLHITSKRGRTDEPKGSSRNRNSNNNNNNRKYRGSGNSSSNQESHKLRTFGAGSTRQEFGTIAEIEIEFGSRFRPTNYHHHHHHQARTSTTAAAGVGTIAETGNDTTCFAGDATSPRENGSEVYVLMRHTSTRELML